MFHVIIMQCAVSAVSDFSNPVSHWTLCCLLQAALDLVADLMKHSTSCMKEGLQHLTSLHFQQELFHESDFNIQANNISRSAQTKNRWI